MVPIFKKEEERKAIVAKMEQIKSQLEALGLTAKIDDRDNYRSGFKFAEWELKGVPVRLAIGPRDLENNTVEVARRDTMTKEASRLIKNAGGKVALAHPVAYTYEDNLTDDDIEKIVKDMNPDGLEANYIYFRKCENRKINEIDKWKQFAKDNKLFETIGSDFHDFNNLSPEIGLINEKIIYDETFVNNIIDNLIYKKS